MKKWFFALAILAAVLVWKFAISPSKLEFTDRVKILQGLNFAAEHKAAITDYWKKNGTFPSRDEWDKREDKIVTDFQNSLVKSIEVGIEGPGVITIIYTNARDNKFPPVINDKTLILIPELKDGVIDWSCKGNLPPDFLPRPCR